LFQKLSNIITNPTPYDIRAMSEAPISEDFFRKEQIYLPSNIIRGPFKNLRQYLDVQFRLLREDYISPIRDSIMSYKANPNMQRYDGGRYGYPLNFQFKKYFTINQFCFSH